MSKYSTALKLLNDQDIKRFACCYLYSDAAKIDWEAAAKDFGSASANSFRTMISASLKKVRDAEKTTSGDDGTPSVPTKATTATTKKASVKRKAKAVAADNDDVGAEDEGYGELPVSPKTKTATPRKRARPAVKQEDQPVLPELGPKVEVEEE